MCSWHISGRKRKPNQPSGGPRDQQPGVAALEVEVDALVDLAQPLDVAVQSPAQPLVFGAVPWKLDGPADREQVQAVAGRLVRPGLQVTRRRLAGIELPIHKNA